MWQIRTSALFDRQLFDFAENYKNIAGLKTADRFLDYVNDAINFIGQSPSTCAVYFELKKIVELEKYEFRKWRVKGFPFSIFFRMPGGETILLEAIYAHKMDIISRLPSEVDISDKK